MNCISINYMLRKHLVETSYHHTTSYFDVIVEDMRVIKSKVWLMPH